MPPSAPHRAYIARDILVLLVENCVATIFAEASKGICTVRPRGRPDQ